MNRLLTLSALILGSLALGGCEEGSYFNSNTTQLRNDKVGRLDPVLHMVDRGSPFTITDADESMTRVLTPMRA